MRIVPVANYYSKLPLNKEQNREWALLDTFDWFSPQYDNPQSSKTIKQWMVNANLRDIEVHKIKNGHLGYCGKK